MNAVDPIISNISAEWYRVEPALKKLIEKNPGFNLTTGEVYNECMDDHAQLWVADEGFIVTIFRDDPYSGYRTLFLWVAASFDGALGDCAQHLTFFDGVAKYMNCKYIELWSSRVGMGRYLAKHDFKEVFRGYRKQVDG